MKLNEYQKQAVKTSRLTETAPTARLVTCALGLASCGGRLAKLVRSRRGMSDVSNSNKVADELGNFLWYLAEAASALGVNLDDVAQANIDKLMDRRPER